MYQIHKCQKQPTPKRDNETTLLIHWIPSFKIHKKLPSVISKKILDPKFHKLTTTHLAWKILKMAKQSLETTFYIFSKAAKPGFHYLYLMNIMKLIQVVNPGWTSAPLKEGATSKLNHKNSNKHFITRASLFKFWIQTRKFTGRTHFLEGKWILSSTSPYLNNWAATKQCS